MNALECFATHAWKDQFTLCLPWTPPRRLYRFILASWKRDNFWLKILVFLQGHWSFYVNNVNPQWRRRKVVCLGWLRLRLLKCVKNNNKGKEVMYNNISHMLLSLFSVLCLWSSFSFNYVEVAAYLSKTVREPDSLSFAQSVNLIMGFSSNESLQYPRWRKALLQSHICVFHRLFLLRLKMFDMSKQKYEQMIEVDILFRGSRTL